MGLPTRVDASTVKLLQADLRKLTKIYQSVPTETVVNTETYQRDYPDTRKWEDAERLFRQFETSVNEWAYKVLIQHQNVDKDSAAQHQIRETAWSFLGEIGTLTLFPRSWSNQANEYVLAPWELDKKRDANIRRYQKRFREFISAVESLIEDEGGSVERSPTTEQHMLAGMTVVLHTLNRAERGEDPAPFLQDLHRQVKAIERAGFKRALRGLTLHLRFDVQGGKGGHYDETQDELVVFPFGMFPNNITFTHEVGHRFWFKSMTNQARAHWNEIMTTQQGVTTQEGVDLFMDKVWNPSASDRELEAIVERSRFDPEIKAMFRYFVDHSPSYTRTSEGVKGHHIRFNVGKAVLIEHITDYGATSPIEAFAEAFQRYVIEGSKALGEWTRSFFERLVKGGRLASARRVVARYQRAGSGLSQGVLTG